MIVWEDVLYADDFAENSSKYLIEGFNIPYMFGCVC